ncbi:MAG: universal stress protein [Planctomycetaceae bacterium]|nr:universal stress protein [Planctomycetaceae bacterium]MBT6158252.1 universal stress protein [Planctomycetaceae bacterium]MBT6487565.1 universal stress protein [Planctomycetaceae bacterium]MBT6493223.1 universal stress protein [Planctomycetaceae bacterium]
MPSLFEKILVPLDFTDKNEAALNICLELAKQNRSQIALLHVIETIPGLPEDDVQDLYDKLRMSAKTKLETIAKRFKAENLQVDIEIAIGKRGPDIVRCAADWQVDLVILSSHKVGIKDPVRNWATLSYQVSIICPCPVLLVK